MKSFNFNQFESGGGSSDEAYMEAIISTTRPSEVVNIQFTSGTTGRPKGACLTHSNIVNNQLTGGSTRVKATNGDRYLVNVPLYHCFGCVQEGVQ